jgi:hypothetical protein
MIAGGMPPAIISTISIVAHFYTALWPSFALPLTTEKSETFLSNFTSKMNTKLGKLFCYF